MARPVNPVKDFHGNDIATYQADSKYAFEVSKDITKTGANLESMAKQFVVDEAGKDLLAVFDTKLPPSSPGKLPSGQGLDLGYAKMTEGRPQLVVGEGKAGDSPLTALGEGRPSTFERNLEVVKEQIELMPLGSTRDALLDQIRNKTYQVEIYVAPNNAAKTAGRIDDVLVDRRQRPVTRVIQFPKKGQ